MLKWVLTLVVAIFVLGMLAPHVGRFIRLGQLPGDLRFRWRGQTYFLPFASVMLTSFLLLLVSYLI